MRRMWLLLFVLAVLISIPASAELFRCPQPDGAELFTDHGMADCQAVPSDGLPPLSSVENARIFSAAPTTTSSPMPPTVQFPYASFSRNHFPPRQRTVAAVLFTDLAPSAKAHGFSKPNQGDGVLLQITVHHLAAGHGPIILSDAHFRNDIQMSLRDAVLAAAQAAQYDPRYLEVRVTLPVAVAFDGGISLDGPSAGLALALAVTSALLDDPLRADLCATGAIHPDLSIGHVGAVEQKINGCHLLQRRVLMVPTGQLSFNLDVKARSLSMSVSTVATLAEAYEAATGQPLRRAQ